MRNCIPLWQGGTSRQCKTQRQTQTSLPLFWTLFGEWALDTCNSTWILAINATWFRFWQRIGRSWKYYMRFGQYQKLHQPFDPLVFSSESVNKTLEIVLTLLSINHPGIRIRSDRLFGQVINSNNYKQIHSIQCNSISVPRVVTMTVFTYSLCSEGERGLIPSLTIPIKL